MDTHIYIAASDLVFITLWVIPADTLMSLLSQGCTNGSLANLHMHAYHAIVLRLWEQNNTYLLTTMFGFGKEREHQQQEKDVLSRIFHTCSISIRLHTLSNSQVRLVPSSCKSALFF